MSEKEKTSLLLLCGALQDISERVLESKKCNLGNTGNHIKEVQIKLEGICQSTEKDQ